MADKITYFAIVDPGTDIERPLGLLRRLEHDDGPSDEALTKDLSWSFTPLIVEWEHGSYERELVEVSHEQAGRIVRYFREQIAGNADL